MKTYIILLSILLLANCSQPILTDMTQNQRTVLDTVLNSITETGYTKRLHRFVRPRHPYSAPDEITKVENAIIEDLELWYGPEAVATRLIERDHILVKYPESVGSGYYLLYGTYSMRNIIATKPGTRPELQPILISAHHDTISISPGTNDNGTGCAGVLEAAFQLKDITFERSIIFAFFAFEEEGAIGSEYYVSTLSPAEYPLAVINLETIGFTSETQSIIPGADLLLSMPTTGNFIGAFGSAESRNLLIDFIKAANEDVKDLPVYGVAMDDNFGSNPLLRDLLRGDHARFWFKGIPGLMITDTADFRENHPYHTENDNLSNVNTAFATKVVKAAISTLCRQAVIVTN